MHAQVLVKVSCTGRGLLNAYKYKTVRNAKYLRQTCTCASRHRNLIVSCDAVQLGSKHTVLFGKRAYS